MINDISNTDSKSKVGACTCNSEGIQEGWVGQYDLIATFTSCVIFVTLVAAASLHMWDNWHVLKNFLMVKAGTMKFRTMRNPPLAIFCSYLLDHPVDGVQQVFVNICIPSFDKIGCFKKCFLDGIRKQWRRWCKSLWLQSVVNTVPHYLAIMDLMLSIRKWYDSPSSTACSFKRKSWKALDQKMDSSPLCSQQVLQNILLCKLTC